MQLAYVFLGYFLGSMLFGYRITWLLKGVDIRKLAEDENPGTYNAFVFGGFWCGILTLLADMGKGYLPVILYRQNYSTEELIFALVMAAPVFGHAFSIFHGRKGGKGIAVMAALAVSNCFWHLPYSVLMFFITLVFFAVPVVVTRYISLGSLLAYAAFFIEMVVFGQLGWFGMEQAYLYELYILVFLLTALAWWRHRANIKRLLNGTENKFGSGKSKSKEG